MRAQPNQDDPQSQAGITLSCMVALGWELVGLRGATKLPSTGTSGSWLTFTDPALAAEHLAQGGGLGLQLGREAGLMVVDGDDMERFRKVEAKLGALPPHSTGRPDRPGHHFALFEEGLAGRIKGIDGQVCADLKGGSGGRAFVVLPSSTPYESGGALHYRRWERDPREGLEKLPDAWREWCKPQAPRIEMGEQTRVGFVWKLSTGAEAKLHNLHAGRAVWAEGRRNDLTMALTALLALKGVEGGQIGSLIQCINDCARGGETRLRMAAVRSTLRRVAAGRPVAGASVYRELGLGDLLVQVEAVVREDMQAQFGKFVV